MKKFLALCSLVIILSGCDVLNNLPTGNNGITEAEAGQGIKEALAQGVTTAVLHLNKTDGFFGNEVYKLFMPPDAQKIVNTLRSLGMSSLVDKAILAINRGAEDAVGFAKPIFVNAIKEMTLVDAINIVRGSNDAATNYFRQKTTDKLIAAFLPSVKSSLDKVNATKYYGDAVTSRSEACVALKLSTEASKWAVAYPCPIKFVLRKTRARRRSLWRCPPSGCQGRRT